MGILAYYDCDITTGPLEGLNNKIKTMKRKAYGFRDTDYSKLGILANSSDQVRTRGMNHNEDLTSRVAPPSEKTDVRL